MWPHPFPNEPAGPTLAAPGEDSARCPGEEALLPLAYGDSTDPSVEGHLSSCAHCRERLLRLRREVMAVRGLGSLVLAPTKVMPPEARPEYPERIGRYKVLRPLGQGGQANVYLAEHPTLGQQVVVKWGSEPMPAAEFDRARLVAEARLLCGLNHPNLARVYDLDTHDERPFVAMEYVRGRMLAQYATDHGFDPTRAAALVAKVARAAAAAHAQGITHRDITPRNVMIDEAGEPRLIDFGLALVRRAHGGVHSVIHEPAGTIAGTPGFMAPEQEAGQTSRIGPRSDVYALGGLLRYLLRAGPQARTIPGKKPADAPRAAEPIPGSSQDLAHLAAGTPAALQRVVARAMTTDPTARYASADELADELQRFAHAAGRPKRRILGAGAAIAVVILIACGGYWLRTFGVGDKGANPHENDTVGRQQMLIPSPAHALALCRPGIYKLIAFGDLAVKTPYFAAAAFVQEPAWTYPPAEKSSSPRHWNVVVEVNPLTDGPTIAEADWKQALVSGAIPAGTTLANFAYPKVIENEARYLFAQIYAPPVPFEIPAANAEEEAALRPFNTLYVQSLHAVPYAQGTAFAVSREGVLLTSASVLAKPAEVSNRVLDAVTTRTLVNLEKQFGGPCPYLLRKQLERTVRHFLRARSAVVYSRFDQAVVVLDYAEVEDERFRHRQQGDTTMADYLAGDGLAENGLGGCVADVLPPSGEAFPGRDVAVLKLRPDGSGVPSWGRPSKARPRDWKDKLVCLPLGDSDAYERGGQVVALGYPRPTADPDSPPTAGGPATDLSREAAAYQVVARSGTVASRELTQGGWDAFRLTTPFDPGQSGGPVVDDAGHIVAIQVAGAADAQNQVGQTLALPINLAKPFLAQAGIKSDPGPVTAHWCAGQDLLRAGRYREAAGEFEAVVKLQGPEAQAAVTAADAGNPPKFILEANAILRAHGDIVLAPGAGGAFSDVWRALAECRRQAKEP